MRISIASASQTQPPGRSPLSVNQTKYSKIKMVPSNPTVPFGHEKREMIVKDEILYIITITYNDGAHKSLQTSEHKQIKERSRPNWKIYASLHQLARIHRAYILCIRIYCIHCILFSVSPNSPKIDFMLDYLLADNTL